MKFFTKLSNGASRLFQKVGAEAPKLLGTISSNLGSASGFVKKIGDFASNIANNPITQILAPEASAFTNALAKSANLGSTLLNNASHLTDVKSYRGDANKVANNILERAKKTREAHDNLIQYH